VTGAFGLSCRGLGDFQRPVPKSAGAKAGYVYLHSIVDGFSRLAYTEPLADEKGKTAAAFLARAKVWFAAHGITHIHRVVTDNGACYRSGDLSRIVGAKTRHQRTKPYTPRHNGKVCEDLARRCTGAGLTPAKV
jgi:transposase InsO family protein